ncbi:MAG: hypothetical protein Q9205_007285, partial [Flavoplaca limonia]
MPANHDQAATAPELDRTILAPEWRGENDAPEAVPDNTKQVYYDNNSPPEAVFTDDSLSEMPSGPPFSDPKSNEKQKTKQTSFKRIVMSILALVSILGIGLGVGLGIGLKRRSGETTNATTTTAATTSPSSDPELPHGIMDDTSLNAFVLRNGDRQVFFQENTGALRRANFSSQVGLWKSADVLSQGIPAARNNTPLSVNYIETSGDSNGTVYVFYASAANDTLICANLNTTTSNSRPCPDWLDLPVIAIAPDSFQLTAVTLTNRDSAFTGLLLVYEDSPQGLVVMLRFVERDVDGFWRDETSKFNAALENDGHAGAQITNSCKAISIEDTSPIANLYSMYCFADLDPHTTSDSRILAYFQFELTVSGNLTVNYTTTSLSNTFGRPEYFSNTSSELILIPQASELERIPMWFKDSTSKAPVGSLPSPSSPFPYHRLATTYGGASDQVYMYHQASDSVLIEESPKPVAYFLSLIPLLLSHRTQSPFNATIPPEEQDFLNADAKFTYAVVLDPSNVGEDGQP